ncbi:nucleoside-diphosphate-sugar epimerase [Lederbergia galactosidilyticus]|uniref:NAD-dependent epimerase/dehydratase family protein n=1 Tax=Lederbergia galactosidilytica TaxID=217031 RepID=UPI001AE14388|nr:NAD(P)-dependent oxidoreductase [Lederbergia galactosidilytica]MBP1915721.1 nucleoside-diphosphate-sugar epimerase [Lederbergia galactosidilytica]
MRMFITGGTGFLGKALARRLVKLGYEVTVLGRNEEVGRRLRGEEIHFASGKLEDAERLEALIHNHDYVFHCGALSSPWGKYEEFYQANVLGTKNVIAACEKHQVKRLIHVSTPSIYFYYNDRFDVREDDKLPEQFVNHYAHTKYLAEKEIDQAFSHGLPVITIRPRALFGPEDTTIIPRLIQVNQKRFIPLVDSGKAKMDLTYIENVVDALLLCIDSPSTTLGKKYNITNGEQVVFREILQQLFNQMGTPMKAKEISFKRAMKLAGILEWGSKYLLKGKEPLLTKYTVSVLGKSQTLNIEAAKKELGYIPRVNMEEGIRLFVEWWKKNE